MSDKVRKKWRPTLSPDAGVKEKRVRLIVNLLLMDDIDTLVPNELEQMLEKAYKGGKHLLLHKNDKNTLKSLIQLELRIQEMLKNSYFHLFGLVLANEFNPKGWK